MDISNFINDVVLGNAANAKENLNDILSAKAFDAIDTQKKELSHTLFGGNFSESDTEVEVQHNEDEVDQ